MIQKGIADEVLNNIELLEMVVDFEKKFYPCNWAKYNELLEGNCKLIPNSNALEIFSKDYDMMKNMLYGFIPIFEEIVSELKVYEAALNKAIKARRRIKNATLKPQK